MTCTHTRLGQTKLHDLYNYVWCLKKSTQYVIYELLAFYNQYKHTTCKHYVACLCFLKYDMGWAIWERCMYGVCYCIALGIQQHSKCYTHIKICTRIKYTFPWYSHCNNISIKHNKKWTKPLVATRSHVTLPIWYRGHVLYIPYAWYAYIPQREGYLSLLYNAL